MRRDHDHLAATLPALALALSVAACAQDDGTGFPDERAALGGKTDSVLPRKAWTFLHYGAADNNLAPFILQDLNELELIGSSADVNLVAFLDTPEGARRVFLEQDSDLFTVSSASFSLGQVDSGAAGTFEEFLAWGISTFPAERYAVAIGGHGGGNPRVIAPDDATGSALTPVQVAAALQSASARTQTPIDVFIADACLMQTIEVAFDLRDVADFIVGSQNTVPGEGLPYDVIAADLLDVPGKTAGELADDVAEAFATAQPRLPGDYVISVVDSSGFDAIPREGDTPILEQLDRLGATLADEVARSPESRDQVRHAARSSFRAQGAGFFIGPSDPFADLDRFLFLLETIDNAEIRDQIFAFRRDAITLGPTTWNGRDADARGARGLSIFLPHPDDPPADAARRYRESCAFCAETSWADMVAAYLDD